MSSKSELKKLSEESLLQPPEKVFDIICKLGEGSYGSVYKALHKESSSVVAIKLVPVESDLHEIIKEISIMQQCDSPYVVRYYGSYFKQYDLWICMEYCGAGSVSDIMRLRKKTLNEDEISTILNDTLKGLEYLHLRRKIHRDIKAGNILLNTEGHAKLADFGVAGQLTDTMAKRNTVIGTPFWMAPEVIEEIGYNCVADIWSLGITALEMAEGKPPYGDIHPMRAIFMIPQKPPPSFREPDRWSTEFIDFVSLCLVKNPEERANATQLLEHDFIRNSKPRTILNQIIAEACEMREHQRLNRQSINNINQAKSILYQQQQQQLANQDDLANIDPNNKENNELSNDPGTLVPEAILDRTMISNKDCGTLIPDNATMIELESNLGTMVINSDSEDSTLKNLDSNQEKSKYRPSFLDHFDKKKTEEEENCVGGADDDAISISKNKNHNKLENENLVNNMKDEQNLIFNNAQNAANIYSDLYSQQPQQTAQQQYPIQASAPPETINSVQYQNMPNINDAENNLNAAAAAMISPQVLDANNHKYEFRNIIDGEFEFLKFLSFDDLQQKLQNIDYEMEKEIEELNKTYQAKRQPIIDAIDAKRKRQQNINNNLIKI